MIDAFSIWSNLNRKQAELIRYDGPSWIIYNSTAGCVKGIEPPIGPVVSERCDHADYTDNRLSEWRVIQRIDNILDIVSTPTIKRTMSYNYIYCYPNDIIIMNVNGKCSEKVYKLPIEVNWESMGYNWKLITKQGNFSAGPKRIVDSIVVPRANFSDTNSSDYELRLALQNVWKEADKLQTTIDNSRIIRWYSPVWWILATLCLLVVLLVPAVLIVCCSKKHRGKRSRVRAVINNVRMIIR